MFDALTNFIVFLENSLQKTSDPAETLELIRILKTARRIRNKRQPS